MPGNHYRRDYQVQTFLEEKKLKEQSICLLIIVVYYNSRYSLTYKSVAAYTPSLESNILSNIKKQTAG